MQNRNNRPQNSGQSITLKAMVIFGLTMLMLIPGFMIQNLITERQERSEETIRKINAKWSSEQLVVGPRLVIPYKQKVVDEHGKVGVNFGNLSLVPEVLDIQTRLYPEERYYGIYKSILYRSEMVITGYFDPIFSSPIHDGAISIDEAMVRIGLSDLRGVTNRTEILINGKTYSMEANGNVSEGSYLFARMDEPGLLAKADRIEFRCELNLNGSSTLDFVPIGKATQVHVVGDWAAPGFVGNYSPQYVLTDKGFDATWSVQHFSRSIPDLWLDNDVSFYGTSFGVNLVDTVDHYQQNMRSAKYALMFIVLTFVTFFFVEVITRKRIHPFQYLLVGVALLVFYTLLLSISEQLSFGWAYLIAAGATIAMIALYAYSIFKSTGQTMLLTGMLVLLYLFLFTVLQLEDVALLIGSVGLFIFLGMLMYFSRKISWYKPTEPIESTRASAGVAPSLPTPSGASVAQPNNSGQPRQPTGL